MSAQAQDLQRSLKQLFPHLTDESARQVAREVIRLINMSAEKGWDLAAVQLVVKGVRRTPIGKTLQDLRVRAGFTQEEVTRRTAQHTRSAPWHVAKVTRIESGVVPITFGDLEFLLHLYGVRDRAVIDSLWALAQASHPPRRATRKAS